MNNTVEIQEGAGVKRLNKVPMTIAFVLAGVITVAFVYALMQRLSDSNKVVDTEAPEQQTIQTADNTDILARERQAGIIPEGRPIPTQPVPSGSQRTITAGQPAVTYQASGANNQQLAGATQTEQEALAELRSKNSIELAEYYMEKQMAQLRFRDSAEQQAKSSPMNVDYGDGSKNSLSTSLSGLGGSASLGSFGGLDANGLPFGGVQGLNNHQTVADAQAAQLAALAGIQGGAGTSGLTDQNNQSGKRAFISGADTNQDYLQNSLANSISPYEIKQGTIIPALMVSSINSDLPGYIIGQVSQNVYDSVTGTNLLIPQGTRIFGQYDSGVTYGQNRVLIVWNRLILPNGKSINVDTMVGSDAAGKSGLKDKTNRHLISLYGQAILLSAISGATEALTQSGNNNSSDLERAISREFGNGLQDTTREVVQREVKRQPTITIRTGKKFVILVDQDIILEPYIGKSANR